MSMEFCMPSPLYASLTLVTRRPLHNLRVGVWGQDNALMNLYLKLASSVQ